MSRGGDTQRVYLFESTLGLGEVEEPIAQLRALARRVWRAESGRRDRCPEVVAGRGYAWPSGGLSSYCEGRRRIVLARHQRCRKILLHELAHALGPTTHGRRFQDRYAHLLLRYL